MIESKITHDIRQYEAKVIGPLNKRQLFSLLAMLPFEIILFACLWGKVKFDTILIFAVLLAMPFAAIGWIKLYETPFEQFVKKYIISFLLSPPKRKIEKNNFWVHEAEIEAKTQLNEMKKTISKKELATYEKELKEKGNNKKKYRSFIPKELEGDYIIYK